MAVEREFFHITRSGERMALSEMTDQHLANTIAMHERLAKKGITIRAGGGGDADEMWYDEWTVKGKEAHHYLGTKHYRKELARRAGESKVKP